MRDGLTIDPEFRDILGRLTDEEYKALEEQLVDEGGARDKIIVWANHDDTIIDGHNRYEICTEHNLRFEIQAKRFETREDVLRWMYKNQSGRRNKTPDQLSYLRGKVYCGEKATLGGDRKSEEKSKDQNDPLISTAEKVASQFGVSQATVKRDAKFAVAIDAIAARSQEAKTLILSGKIKGADADVKKFSELPEKTAQRVAALIVGGKVKSVGEALIQVGAKEPSKPRAPSANGSAKAAPPPAPKPEPTPAPAVDSVGTAIPKKSIPAFERASEFDGINRELTAIAKKIKELAESDVGVFLHLQSIEADIGNAKRAVKFAKPYAVCGYCKGKGCKACKESGWVPKNIYESTPE